MPNILLGVTGSVAASRVPALYQRLRDHGWSVKIVATRAACYFFDHAGIEPLDPTNPRRNPEVVVLDEDEWPGQETGQRWQRDDPVQHIELRRWADLFLIAPLDANTLAKLANGLCDNCLTCVWRAWDLTKPVVLAPAMNTLMWEHPLTRRHLLQLASAMTLPPSNEQGDQNRIIESLNKHSSTMCVVPPQIKQLACGDTGIGAMAEIADIVVAVENQLNKRCPSA